MDTPDTEVSIADRIRSVGPYNPEDEAPALRPDREEAGDNRAVTDIGKARKARNPRKTQDEPGWAAAVASPAATLASPAERNNARELLTTIGVEFAGNRQKSKSKAFETYQRAIATNLGTLVMGGAITMKEGTVLLMDLEAFMKSGVREGETAATRLQKFLAGELEADDE